MKNLQAKLKKQGGFTLVEMLIVVAIIAILIAVSIPMVNNALERTKHATDAANERAAKAEILLCYLADVSTSSKVDQDEIWFYDAAAGKLTQTFSDVTGYGKHNGKGHGDKYVLALKINTNDEVIMAWVNTNTTSLNDNGDNLCSNHDVEHSAT